MRSGYHVSAIGQASIAALLLIGGIVASVAGAPPPHRAESLSHVLPVNIIDGIDERDSILKIGPSLGLSGEEIARIRKVSGYVGCLSPSPSVGAGALFLSNRQILTVAHIFFEPSGERRRKCFFKNQDENPVMIDLLLDEANVKFGADRPKPGSNHDYAIVRLTEPVDGAEPFPVDGAVPVAKGDRLIVVTAHPAGMAKEVDNAIPVAQGCAVRRAPKSSSVTSFYRSDCDATGSSSGGMNLSRVGDRLVFRGINITTGPWRDQRFHGAPYDEKAGSVTTALGTDAAILRDGQALAGAD